jgi:hypothetical protein
MHYPEPDEHYAILAAAHRRNRTHHLMMLTSVCHGLRVTEMIGRADRRFRARIEGAF